MKVYGNTSNEIIYSLYNLTIMQPTEQVVAHNKNCVLPLGCGHSVGPRNPNTQTLQKVCVWCVLGPYTQISETHHRCTSTHGRCDLNLRRRCSVPRRHSVIMQ